MVDRGLARGAKLAAIRAGVAVARQQPAPRPGRRIAPGDVHVELEAAAVVCPRKVGPNPGGEVISRWTA
jgi:hypothetical protein